MAGITESRLEDQVLSITATDEFQLGDGSKMKSTRQQVLVRLDIEVPILVLSLESTTSRCGELSFMGSISGDEGSGKVREWFLICLPIGLVLFLWIMVMLLLRNQ